MTNDRVWPYPELDGIASAGILVDGGGRRLVDEGRGGIFMANAVAALADPLSTTVVFDATIWDGPGRSARIPANPQLARAGGTVHQAGSIAGLAAAASLPAETLAITIEATTPLWRAMRPPCSTRRGRRRASPLSPSSSRPSSPSRSAPASPTRWAA